jgi:hypothetical protein
MKPPPEEDMGSLDSLLDTMTNVVGILVIVLIISQVKMSQTVDKIFSDLPVVSEVQYLELKKLVDAHDRRQDTLQEQWGPLKDTPPQSDLARLTHEEAALKDRIANTKKSTTGQQLVSLRQQTEALEKKLAPIRASITELDRSLAEINKDISEVPKGKAPPARVVRLPNPRPAPEGAKPARFICRNNRLFYIDYDTFQAQLTKRVVEYREKLMYKDPKTRKPPDPKRHYYSEKMIFSLVKDRLRKFHGFGLVPVNAGNKNSPNLHIKLVPLPGQGVPLGRVAGKTSPLPKLVSQLLKEKRYAEFIVYPDGMEVYMEARQYCERRKLLAGWVAQNADKLWWTPHKIFPEAVGKLPDVPKPKPKDPNAKPAPPPPKPNVLD